MHETQVNGTQADEKRVEETPSDGGGGDGWGVEKARRLRLGEFLRDLIRQEGKMEAAELLGVNNKTLTRAEESGEITGRMADALELLLRRADDAEVARLRETVGALEERLAAVEGRAEMPEGGVNTPDAADAKGDGESGREGNGEEDEMETQVEDEKPDEGAGRSETGAAPQAVAVAPSESRHVAAVRPGDRDRGACRRRRGNLRGSVAPGRGVAQPAGRSSESGEEPVVAQDAGAAARSGAGDAGGARADPAAGEAAAQGLRAQWADDLASDGPGQHAEVPGQAGAAALGRPVAVAQVSPGAVSGAGFWGAAKAQRK